MASLQSTFGRISGALGGKPTPDGGTLNIKGYGKAGDMTTRNANILKMKALGLDTMPDGGQEELDMMYADHLKRTQK